MERRIPERFGRMAMAFDEVAHFRQCESSGSEHSPDGSFIDLADLVNSFLERDDDDDDGGDSENGCKTVEDQWQQSESDELWSDTETSDELRRLMSYDSDECKEEIRKEIEKAMGLDVVGMNKRELMSKLRQRGLDAGICKSKWEKTSRIPSGEFEYLDINMRNIRYIVELNLASHFEIARQTKSYTTLLNIFPKIYIGKIEDLKRIVRLMCAAVKVSLKSVGLPVAPWRRNGYMQVKWFGFYKRTLNAVPSASERSAVAREFQKPLVGFEFDVSNSRQGLYGCRVERQFAAKGRAKLGYLAATFAVDTTREV